MRPLPLPLLVEHRDDDIPLVGDGDCLLVAGVGVTDYTHARVVGEDPFQPPGCLGGSVGHHLGTGMDRLPDTYAATVMHSNPGCP